MPMVVGSGQAEIALLTFNSAEAAAVTNLLTDPQRPFQHLSGDRYGLNSGVIEHFPLGRAGNVQTAAFAAERLTPGSFHFLVTYGCAGTPDPSLVCSCRPGRRSSKCSNPFLVSYGRYHEHGQVKDPPSSAAGVYELPTLKNTFRDPQNEFRFPLSDHVRANAPTRSGMPLSSATAFVSEKVIHASPGASPPTQEIPYRDALEEITTYGDVVVEMESKGLAAGAPRYEFLSVVVRVVTDHGTDKPADARKILQAQRLEAHVDELHDVLDYLTRPQPLSLRLYLLAIPTGAAREEVQLRGILRRSSESPPARVIASRATELLINYRPLVAEIDGWTMSDLAGRVEDEYSGDSYPRPESIARRQRLPAWDELVYACDDPVPLGFDIDSTGTNREAQRDEARDLASEVRSMLIDMLSEYLEI